MSRVATAAVLAPLIALLLAGCTPPVQSPPLPTSTVGADGLTGPVSPVGTPEVIASGLQVPWSIVRLDSGSTLISERDRGVVVELTADGELRDVGSVEGSKGSIGSEGGLLGLAVLDEAWLYAYITTDADNRILRFALEGEPGSYSLGASEVLLTGLLESPYHNGGRIAFGPDGLLYVTVGDATNDETAQDVDSLNGKILRMTPTGGVPEDNPFDSLVYSMGHRNPQGLTWDDEGQLWASEFGQDTWDELNRIEAGGNYGWPVVEGRAEDPDYIDPVAQWGTQDASPSGLVYTRGTFFMAALRGERLWVIYPNGDGHPDDVAYFEEEYGRIRDVVAGPDGSLWLITNNTDGRGDPADDDDKLIQVQLDVLHEG
jgi:glucose/arabinose dehydrogenase